MSERIVMCIFTIVGVLLVLCMLFPQPAPLCSMRGEALVCPAGDYSQVIFEERGQPVVMLDHPVCLKVYAPLTDMDRATVRAKGFRCVQEEL